MARKAYIHNDSSNKTIYSILVFLIAVFMLIIPFYRGLFFRSNYIPATIFISAIFAGFSAYKLMIRKYEIINTYMDLSVLLLPAAYLISLLFAVNAKDAFDMFLIYCSYFMLYKLTADLSAKNEKFKNIFINVIIASTFLLSFTAMLNIAGLIDVNGAFVGKRLYGLYQYANTTASVLGVGIILALNRFINEENTKKAVIYQMVLTALISSFIFTLSRGGYLVLVGILLLNFFLVKARVKLRLLLSLFVSLISSLMLIYKYYTLAEEGLSAVWIHYLTSIIVSAIIIYIIYSFKNLIKLKFPDKLINIALITMAVIFTGVAVFLFSVKEPIEYRIEHQASEEKSWKNKSIILYEPEPNSVYTVEFDVKASVESPNSYRILIRSYNAENKHTDILKHAEPIGTEYVQKSFEFTTLEDTERIRIYLYNYETGSYTVYNNVVIKDSYDIVIKKMEKLKYVPAVIANRLADINLETRSVSLRTNFAKDGIKIIKDYPITGAGGGAWKNLYRQYQSMPYNTTEVHNFYVQYGAEVGIIGLTALGALLLLMVISMVRSIRSDSHYTYIYLAAELLLLHSTIDFNLSLPAVGYMLWMLIGIIRSEGNSPRIEKLQHKYMGLTALALSLIIFFMASSINYGIKLGTQAVTAIKEDKAVDKAIEMFEKAAIFDRYNASYRYDLAQVFNNQLRRTKDKKYLDGFNEQISLIRKYDPYNHQYTPVISSMNLAIGRLAEASELADKKLEHEPMLNQSYMLKIDVNYQIANYYLKENKVQEAVPYLEKVIKAEDELDELNNNLKKPLKLEEDYTKKVEAASKTLEMIKADMIK